MSKSPEASPAPQPQQSEEPDVVTDIPVLHTAKRLKLEARRLDGMQRELYSLIGDNSAPVAITPESKYKTKPGFQQKAASWKLVNFRPKTGLELRHWVRAAMVTGDMDIDRFAKFNTKFEAVEWTDEEYTHLFSSEDWSLEETRYLFQLVTEYELRWFVIADRYDFGTKKRTIEDLKERYYQVCTALVENKKATQEIDPGPVDDQLIAAMKYPKETEIKRKSHLEQLLARTPKEVAEEEALVLESRKLEAMSDKLLTERREILQLLDSVQAISSKLRPDLITSQGVAQLLADLQNEKEKKPAASSSGSTPVATSPSATVHEPTVEQNDDPSIAAKLRQHRLNPREQSAYGITPLAPNSVRHAGVYLRSTKILPIRQALLTKVRNVTNELDIPLKPVMATARVCTAYDNLLQEICTLLEAKKVQDRLEMEVEVLRKSRESVGVDAGSNENTQTNEEKEVKAESRAESDNDKMD